MNALLLSITLLAQVTAGWTAQPYLMGERITLSQSDGVVVHFSASKVEQDPSRQEVEVLEEELPSYLANGRYSGTRIQRELARYKRQYSAVVNEGRRQISVQFFHDTSTLVEEGAWLKLPITVMGGGDNFFRATFDVESEEFVSLFINAPE